MVALHALRVSGRARGGGPGPCDVGERDRGQSEGAEAGQDHGAVRVERAIGEQCVTEAEQDHQTGQEAVQYSPGRTVQRQARAQHPQKDHGHQRDGGQQRHAGAGRAVGRHGEQCVVGGQDEQRAHMDENERQRHRPQNLMDRVLATAGQQRLEHQSGHCQRAGCRGEDESDGRGLEVEVGEREHEGRAMSTDTRAAATRRAPPRRSATSGQV